jgi:hypothetical protein
MGGQRVCEKAMKPEGKFTVTQYAIFAKLSPPFAKTRLNELVKAGLAKKLWTNDSVQSRDKLYLVTTFPFKANDPFDLHKRKEKPSDPNAWMWGVRM